MSQFQVSEADGIQTIVLPPDLNQNIVKDLESATKSWLMSSSEIHILDFKAVQAVHNLVYRPLILFNQALRQAKKNMFCTHLPDRLIPQFRQDGLLGVFIPVRGVQDAKNRAKAMHEQKKVDVDLVNAFVKATRNVLEMQAATKLILGKPRLRKESENLPADISGVININCEQFKGVITLSFPAAVFLRIYENMVGETHTTISPEIEDAAGELLNIIFGQVKTSLNDSKGYNLQKALPTIFVGDKMRVRQMTTSPTLILPFGMDGGEFFIEIAIDNT